jgi:release factor glutamine methyltransferase
LTRIAELLADAPDRLAGASDSPSLDAEILLAQVLGLSRTALRARGDETVDDNALRRFRSMLDRRAAGEPVAYLTGRRGFWSLDLEVDPAVLVPRPETELLVVVALELLRGIVAPCILDLGTGSGAIAIALGVELPSASILAVDASGHALEVARRNAAAAGAANVDFQHGDWFEPAGNRRFDAIVANPPYLAETDPHLPALAREPAAALVAGPTGLEALAEIIALAPRYLHPGGLLMVEHGCEQGPAVRSLCVQAGLVGVATRTDLAGLERATLARRPAKAGVSG